MATLAQYQKMTTTQRNQVKRDELKKLLDEALDTDVSDGSLRSLITDTITQTLDTKMNELKTELKNEYKNDVANLNTEIDTLRSTVNTMKVAMLEQQKFLERSRFESCKNNAFITGLPCTMDISGTQSSNADDILHEALKTPLPDIARDSYIIIKNFPPRTGMTRHSAKIQFKENDTKKLVMNSGTKYSGLPDTHSLRKVLVRNDQPPLTRKENDRLRTKMWQLRNDDADNSHNYRIDKGVLYKDNIEIDKFNLINQLF